ncbi:c-type cytochrome [Marinobacter litoralis]|uniref:c-type cytochrome n=1 Tax=Marinobacter litoralis TaxID=187981 RepID=UPI0018EE2B81|nr:cytochrome c [Marinobacter litoralis]MBJ6138980.1 cytochrome c [Marinobacter litoralis]
MFKKIFGAVVALGILALAIFLLIAWESSINPISPPGPDAFSKEQIKRGEVLAGLGNCETCHTTDPAKPLAGGRAMPTPFGTLYSTNITPDPDKGIGQWSEEAFSRAMREGVSRSGSHLFPAFPYTHFTKLSDDDISDLYAYVMSRQAIAAEPPENTLEFPYNIRLLLAGWKLLFFDEGRFEPDADKGDVWNRGAYIAEGAGHCSACHTPRNALGAEDSGKAWEGAIINNWYAPALNANNRTPAGWTEKEAYEYLRHGGSPFHGVAVGSMSDVVHDGLKYAPDSDLRALAVWLSDLAQAPGEQQAHDSSATAIRTAQQLQNPSTMMGEGERLFAHACAACHYNEPNNPNTLRPDMALNSAISAPTPVNLIRVTLNGVSLKEGIPEAMMPGFGQALSDRQIASLLAYLRSTHTDLPAWTDLEQQVRNQRP